jgi:hypothetical protein
LSSVASFVRGLYSRRHFSFALSSFRWRASGAVVCHSALAAGVHAFAAGVMWPRHPHPTHGNLCRPGSAAPLHVAACVCNAASASSPTAIGARHTLHVTCVAACVKMAAIAACVSARLAANSAFLAAAVFFFSARDERSCSNVPFTLAFTATSSPMPISTNDGAGSGHCLPFHADVTAAAVIGMPVPMRHER